jgi:hypothetical protein
MLFFQKLETGQKELNLGLSGAQLLALLALLVSSTNTFFAEA